MTEARDVDFVRAGEVLRGYLAHPSERGPFPAIVLIPDVRGVYEHYRDIARRLAAEGFLALALDLYSREGPPDLPDMAAITRWIRNLPDDRVLADIQAGVDYLAARPDVHADAVGITGFCMGGQYAILAACLVKRLSACVSWYGMLRYHEHDHLKVASPLEVAAKLSCPYLGLFGEEDGLIPLADVAEFRDTLERSGKTFEIKTYARAGHAFFNDTRADAYRPAAAADAWPRSIAFFREHLTRPK